MTLSTFPHKIGLFPTPYTTNNKSIEEKILLNVNVEWGIFIYAASCRMRDRSSIAQAKP